MSTSTLRPFFSPSRPSSQAVPMSFHPSLNVRPLSCPSVHPSLIICPCVRLSVHQFFVLYSVAAFAFCPSVCPLVLRYSLWRCLRSFVLLFVHQFFVLHFVVTCVSLSFCLSTRPS